MNILFEYPLFLLLIPAGLIAVWKLVRQKSVIGFSSASLLIGTRVRLPLLVFERIALAVFVIAGILILARPIRLERTATPVYQEARDITIALDISGSMRWGEGNNLTVAIGVISEFVAARPQDRIALFVFDTASYLEWPLSVDHDIIIYRLQHLGDGGGTVISSGITDALEHQAQFGQNSGAVIVVSDGASSVSAVQKEAIENALGDTKLYWIWIVEGVAGDPLALVFGDYVRSLGGGVYRGETEELESFFAEISQLESSPVVWENIITTEYQFGLLPLAALIGALGAGLLHLFREV